jgi:glycosyltransferase involved in cell wall biosynthesis
MCDLQKISRCHNYKIFQDISIKTLKNQYLNKIHYLKTIFYLHATVFSFLYRNFFSFQNIYKEYINSKYIISLVPIENDYLFQKWGINSILMDNFMTYEYNSTKPFDLSSETIIMLGRADDKNKRFFLGIQAMEYIIKEKLECEMKIISYINKNTNFLMDLANNINLKNNIKFVGFTSQPEILFKNASLHIMPSISESFSLAVGETKIYGIPTIILGLNYLSLSNFGTIILYDDTPENIARESLKILNNEKYRKILGKKAKQSMKRFNNKILLKKWLKLILCIYNGNN